MDSARLIELAKMIAAHVRMGAAQLSDALAGISWKRFVLLAFFALILIGALPNWILLNELKDLTPAAIIFCALLKAQAKSRREAAQSRDEARRQAGVATAKAMALEARLDPHFLFNAMGAIEHLIATDPSAAARAQRALSVYLRSGLGQAKGSTVASQAKACEAYLEIQSIRMGERLGWSATWSSLEQPMPARVAVGLLETAVALSIEPAAQGGSVDIECLAIEDSRLAWRLRCPSQGVDAQAIEPWREAWMSQAPTPSWTEKREGGRLEISMEWRPMPAAS